MQIIENINNLRTRNMNKLTRYIINLNKIDSSGMMVLSSVAKQNKNNFNIKDIFNKYENNIFFDEKYKTEYSWKCNIQQIKKEYNGVLFSIYFKDCVCIYKIESKYYDLIKNMKNSQHKDNINEMQFFINNNNVLKFEIFLYKKIYYSNIERMIDDESY